MIMGNVTFYGLLYVIGNLNLQGNLTANGVIAAEGTITKSAGNVVINFDPAILNNLHNMNNNTVLYYYDSPASIKEVIA